MHSTAFSMAICVASVEQLLPHFASSLKNWGNRVLYRSHCATRFYCLPLVFEPSPRFCCPTQHKCQLSVVWLQHVCERWTSAVNACLAALQCESLSDTHRGESFPLHFSSYPSSSFRASYPRYIYLSVCSPPVCSLLETQTPRYFHINTH